jgi:hypothetical protein
MMYVQVFDYEVTVEEYEAMITEVKAEWDAMDDYDRQDFEDYEDFEEFVLHSMLYSED